MTLCGLSDAIIIFFVFIVAIPSNDKAPIREEIFMLAKIRYPFEYVFAFIESRYKKDYILFFFLNTKRPY